MDPISDGIRTEQLPNRQTTDRRQTPTDKIDRHRQASTFVCLFSVWFLPFCFFFPFFDFFPSRSPHPVASFVFPPLSLFSFVSFLPSFLCVCLFFFKKMRKKFSW